MKCLYLFGLVCYLYLAAVSCFLRPSGNSKPAISDGKPDNPLILTPLIKKGKIREAQAAAEVRFGEFGDIKSYAGYFTVNENYDSNLFFWFFPSETDYENAPVVLWLNGGPGASSMIGLFTENGPFEVTPDGNVLLRKHSWTENHSVIYIDSPVGTGFSYSDADGYARNETAVGTGLYNALLQFFQVFPDLQKNDFFATGESYAGKYVPAVSYAIYQNNPTAKLKINLQGLAIGNGWCAPEHHMVYSDYLYQIGVIDSNAKVELQNLEKETIKHINNKQWKEATKLQLAILDWIINETGIENIFNYLRPTTDVIFHEKYLNRSDVKAAIHVGNAEFCRESNKSKVMQDLYEDYSQSISPWISELLSHYRILFYNGQLDMGVPYPLTVNFLKNLNFSGAEEYKKAARQKWYVNSELAGYAKQAGNLIEVLVRDGGHLLPQDQPVWALDLITKFTRNESLHQ